MYDVVRLSKLESLSSVMQALGLQITPCILDSFVR